MHLLWNLRPLVLAFTILVGGGLRAQCPQLYDGEGLPSNAPEWFSCSGTAYTLLVGTPQTVGPYTIDWGDGSPLHTGSALVPPMTVAHIYSAAVATYTLTFTDLTTGCVVTGTLLMEQSTSASIQIPVGGLTQVCAPHPVDFINSSTNVSPNTTFTWDFGDGSPPLTFDHTNWGQTISHMYEKGTVDCETVVTLTASNVCNELQGGPSVATFNPIRIWDIDDASISPSATLLCWPDNEVTYVNTTDRNCYTQGNIYQRYEYWNFGDYWGLGHDSIIDWTPWPPTFPHTIAYPGVGVYEVMMLDSNYCGIDTAYIQIEIVPPPSVSLTAEPALICAGGTVVFDQTVGGGANQFQWDFGTGNGFQTTGAGDQAHTYHTPGIYTVSFTASITGASQGCTDTASVVVEVLESPHAAFTVDQDAACEQITVAFTNASTTAGTTFHWDLGDGTSSTLHDPPPHTYSTPGTYQVTLTVTNEQNCSAQAVHTIHVFNTPQPQIGAPSVCLGMPSMLTDLTATEPGNPVVAWSWDLGDGTTSADQAPIHTYSAPGTYTVALTVTTPYCSGSTTLNVQVEAPPTAALTPSTQLGCSPLPVDFTNTSVGGASAIWLFGDGAGANTWDATHTYTNYGTSDTTYIAQLVVATSSGCVDTLAVPITVAPAVNALFTHDAETGCAPMDVHFTNHSTGAGSFQWNFGDGTTSTDVDPQHTYVNTTLFLQSYTVHLVASSPAGCADSASTTIVVYPTPDFAFVAAPDSGCSPLNVTFPSVVGAVTYQWDFGDGTYGTGPSPVHTYLNTTDSIVVYPVTMVGANAFGCTDTTSAQITVFPDPVAQMTVGTTTGCHPLTVELVNTSTGADQFTWTYGDGQSATIGDSVHTHTWFNYGGVGPATYPVSLTATTVHGCTSTATMQVEVFPAVTAAFLAPDSGCAPLTVPFVNMSTGAVSHQWYFGDGMFSAATAPVHTYDNQALDNITFNATLVAVSAYGCADTATHPIVVHPRPIAQFVPSTTAGCQPLAVGFQDITIGATTMNWTFGDGSTVQSGPGDMEHSYTHSAPDPVTFEAVLVAASVYGCTDTAQVPIQVYPQVVAAFAVDEDGCSPHAVAPVEQTVGAASLLWDMGNGNVLVGPTPQYTYVNTSQDPQSWTITLTATSIYGCTAQAQHEVTVHPVPFAAFQATPFVQQYPDATVNIANNSSPGAWSYQWSMGDGTTSTAQHPGSHTYATWGQYSITLVVYSPFCADTVTQLVEIQPPLPTASFIGSGEGCAPLTVQFINTSLGGLSYQWNFGDGGTSSATDPVHTYTVPGTYTVSLTAQGIGGGVNTVVKVDSVVVRPNAMAYFVLMPDEVVVPSQPVFTYNLSGNATSYLWDFGDGTTYTTMNPVHYYTEVGSYDVTLVANNQWNCPDTFVVENAVRTRASGTIRFPNAFTPDDMGPGDGTYDPQDFSNNVFFPVYEGVEDYRLEIFNRWGELIFVSDDVRIGWNGWYRGRPAKQDVYVWKAFARFSDGRETVLKGDVTLLR